MEDILKGVLIKDAINKTSYDPSMKMEIMQLIALFFSTKQSEVYLITRLYSNHEETIFLIHHHLPLLFDGLLSLIIYLPSKFPLAPPEIHLEKKDNNSELKIIYNNSHNNMINNSTLQINYELMIKWNRETKNINQILQLIKKVFEKDYPFTYTNFPMFRYNGLCVLQRKFLIPIILNEIPQIKPQPIISNLIYEFENETKPPTQNMTQLVNQHNPCHQRQSSIDYNKIKNNSHQSNTLFNELMSIKFTDDYSDKEKIKDILKKEIELSLNHIILKQRNELMNQHERLENVIQKFKSKQENQLILDKNTLINSYDLLKGQYTKQLAEEQCELNNYRNVSNQYSFDNINSFITVEGNTQIIKLDIMEMTIEEFLLTFKKTIQRNTISFDEVVRQYRLLTREMFYFHYLKTKASIV